MPRLSSSDAASVRAIADELDTIRIGGPPALDVALPELRRLMRTESVLAYKITERAPSWQLDLFHHDGFHRGDAFERRCQTFFAAAPRPYAWYNAVRPEPEQRNRVFEAVGRIPPGQYESSVIYRDVMEPLKLERHRQLRVLVCEGPALLAWVGAFHPDPVDARQHRLLAAVVPALRRRLSIEQRLRASPRVRWALNAVLDQLAAPAFVLGREGQLHEMNASGRTLLATSHAAVLSSLRDAVARRPNALAFEVTPLRENASCVGWLAILRSDTPDARVAACVTRATAKWCLTPRQNQVLDFVARGLANATIAATIGIGERAVELHVSAIFDRAGVESRSALIATVLLL
ncbi:MAG TPA: LuxR C-terminal-related transcriptional regulator [Polyangia bacterium]|nr:LuxR C-terminal-related transcriptional regulator [Polyangia bacterium]